MAEAVFSIGADITPQLDESALQRQAEQLSAKINGVLAKQIQPVSFKPATGSFRPFQQEVDKARGVLDKFRDNVSTLPRSFGNVARTGRSAFLKFTDAVNLTRREFVGFGSNIRDTIRNTNLFEDALDGIKSSGSAIQDLPDSFQNLAAQIRSGVSAIDQMAAGGNTMAQLFQPLQQQGEAARTEFVELNRSIDILTSAVNKLNIAQTKGASLIDKRAAQDPFSLQIKSAEELKTIVAGAPAIFQTVEDSINAAFAKGTPEELLRQLVAIKDQAQAITGPMGRIAQLINEKSGGRFFAENTKEARELAIELEQGVIGKIRELFGPEALGPIENFNAKFREITAGVRNAVNAFNSFRTGLANILPGRSPVGILVDNLSKAIPMFTRFKAEGLDSFQAVGRIATETFSRIKIDTGFSGAIQRIKSELAGLAATIATTKIGGAINQALGNAGPFISRNLLEPLRQAGPQIKEAFSKIGQDAANGLGIGVDKNKTSVAQKAKEMGQTFLNSLKKIMRSASPSKATEEEGQNATKGFVQGIQSGLGAVAQSAATFAKSFLAVTGTALAGLGATALLTGKNFNVLKQVINASLPVLVGSKEASKELLVQINALNDSSPFARDTFLEMTRVLAGFGVEAKKITPLVDSIQQAVAATGGSDQDLLELSQAFAKIQSQGRVTGEILQSFSVRGIDAVGLLAQGFGKLPTEMRKMISDGLVPAGKAIDVLTKGLKDKFDGATDAVSKNFPGALQRVQARLRDIGGTLLKAFITPEGGGALVDFLNNMADLLSHINKEVLPALAPALQIVANALVTVSEKMEGFVKQLSGKEFGEFLNHLKPWLPLLAGLAGLLPAAFGFIPVIGPIIAGLGGPFTAAAAAIAVFLAQSGQLGNVMDGVTDSLTKAKDAGGGALEFLKDNISGFFLALAGGAKGATSGVSFIQKFLGLLGSGVSGVASATKVLTPFGKVFQFITTTLSKVLGPFEKLFGFIPGLAKEGGALAKVFPNIAGGLKILSGPFGIVISIFAQLVLTSQRFREALMTLWNAIKPVADIIIGVFAVGIQILDEAVKALEPAFTAVVLILAKVFDAMKPVLNWIKEFLGFLREKNVIGNFFAGVKEAIESVLKVVIGAINVMIAAWNKLPFHKDIEPIKFDLDTDPAVKASKKAADEFRKHQAELRKAAEDSAAAVEDNFNKASHAVETAGQAMGNATEQLLQAISTASGIIDGLIQAGQAVQNAAAAVNSARQKEAEATANVTKLQEDYAKALRDVIAPEQELAKAQRDLRDIQKSKIALDREEINIGRENAKLQQELADLTGERANQDRAALARAEERAVINLNKAKQAQLDLENELNNAGKVSIDLTGLSLDQIRTQLSAARALAKAKGKQREMTEQEKKDASRSAQLDVEDAQQGVTDAQKERAQFEIDTGDKITEINEKIRDNNERINEIIDDRADQLLEEQAQIRSINSLLDGQSTKSELIKDWDDKIAAAKQTQKEAAQAIETATRNSAIEQAQFRLKTAEAKGDADGILKAHQDLWALQTSGSGLNFQAGALAGILHTQMENIQHARDAAREMKEELAKANKLLGAATALQGLSSAAGSFDTAQHSFENAIATNNEPAQIKFGTAANKAQDAVIKGLRAALQAGAAEQRGIHAGEPWLPNNNQVEAVIRNVIANAARESLRDAIRDALLAAGVSMPGFAAARGLSPGMIHHGLNNGKGLVRMFEFGKEAVLPLTRPKDMARIVRDPRVLPAVLKAIPGFARGFAPGQNIVADALSSPNSELRKILKEIFQQMGLSFPGFSTGYAPGDLAGTGSAYKTFDVSNFASDSLSPILNSLPRWSMPTGTQVSLDAGTSNDLSSVVRTARQTGGPSNADVYEKKSQREYADLIGASVKQAVIEAISESDGLVGDDIDINVNPHATETQRMIAREVKRQLDKRTGKW